MKIQIRYLVLRKKRSYSLYRKKIVLVNSQNSSIQTYTRFKLENTLFLEMGVGEGRLEASKTTSPFGFIKPKAMINNIGREGGREIRKMGRHRLWMAPYYRIFKVRIPCILYTVVTRYYTPVQQQTSPHFFPLLLHRCRHNG